jgi:transcription initiation factor TFIID TATA-box-binding protein
MENAIELQSSDINLPAYNPALILEKKKMGYSYKIINIVASGYLTLNQGVVIDFDDLERKIVLKRMSHFPSVVFKVAGVSIILFKNGKMIITGIHNINQIIELKQKIALELSNKGIEFKGFEVKIENLIAMTQLGKCVDLEMLCLKMNNVLYDPQQFSAAIIKPHPKCTFLLFGNSKIICLGIRDLEQLECMLYEFIDKLYQIDVFRIL